MGNIVRYPQSRPDLTIECTGGKSLERCYSASYWRITSLNRIKKDTINQLFQLGLVGIGQAFDIRSQCDGKEPPAFVEEIAAVEFDMMGAIVPGMPINEYSGKPFAPSRQHVYVYECETRCDSGD